MTKSDESFSHQLTQGERERLQVLMRTALSELEHLQQTDQRLFAQEWTVETLTEKMRDIDFAERVDAFVARFGRLQDLLGDKYLPAWMKAMQEAPGAVLENLDRAEKLGLIRRLILQGVAGYSSSAAGRLGAAGFSFASDIPGQNKLAPKATNTNAMTQ